jgi:hypothetical protein
MQMLCLLETLVLQCVVSTSEQSADTDRVEKLCASQRSDSALVTMLEYLERDVLPTDEKLARKVSGKYEVVEGVLYFVYGEIYTS